jgi:Domain of unknown function (DUF4398)
MASRKVSLWPWMAVPLLCGGLIISGCSAGKPPLGTLSQAELAVQQADKSTASVYAPLELQTARDQLSEAKRAMAAEEYEEARRFADHALVNAQLAEAKAGAGKARAAAEELRKSIQTLRGELERVSTTR